MTTTLAHLGDRLRSLRQERGWTQADLAQRVGIGQQVLSGYETGRRTPSLETTLALARTLDVSVDDLVAGDG